MDSVSPWSAPHVTPGGEQPPAWNWSDLGTSATTSITRRSNHSGWEQQEVEHDGRGDVARRDLRSAG